MTTTAPDASTRHEDDTAQIAVENPATGEVIGHVADMTAADVAELARRGRAAQPGWEALGFDGRARVLKRMQRWVMDNADRVVRTIVSETGKTYEDAQIAELAYGAAAFGFWAHKCAALPRRRADPLVIHLRQGQTAGPAVQAGRARRRHRPLELPADEFVRRLHPRARRGQQRHPQAVGDHAVDIVAAG